MSVLYIRNVDPQTQAALEAVAAERKISVAELARQVLDNYVTSADANNLNQKYQTFVTDLLKLYQANYDELREALARSDALMEKNADLYDRLISILEEE